MQIFFCSDQKIQLKDIEIVDLNDIVSDLTNKIKKMIYLKTLFTVTLVEYFFTKNILFKRHTKELNLEKLYILITIFWYINHMKKLKNILIYQNLI